VSRADQSYDEARPVCSAMIDEQPEVIARWSRSITSSRLTSCSRTAASYGSARDENEDLFWPPRGGGGNFGVVTAFTFRLHPVSPIVGGPTLWRLEEAGDVLRWYRQFQPNAPEDTCGFFAFLTVPPAPPFSVTLQLQKMCGIVVLPGAGGNSARGVRTGTRGRPTGAARRSRDALPDAAGRLRHPLPVPRPVVPAGRPRHDDP
jgi:hypothetical protein